MKRDNAGRRRFRIRLNQQQRMLLGFISVIMISICVSVLSYQMQTRRDETRKQVDAANLVIKKAEDVMLGIVNMETGFRGFLITGQEIFLDPYKQGDKSVTKTLDELDQLAAGDEKALGRWAIVRDQVKSWEGNWANPGMELRRKVDTGEATIQDVVDYESRSGGKMYTDTIRAMVSDAQNQANKALQEAKTADEKAAKIDLAVKIWGNLAGAVIGIIIAIYIAQTISHGVRQMVKAAEHIARGEINQTITYHSDDEIGQLANAFRNMIAYIQNIARAADALADSNLSVNVRPRSDNDVLGYSFVRMTANLRAMVEELNENVQNLTEASDQLAETASQASQATSQIATTIQQVARGTGQQTEATTHTAEAIDQMGTAIEGVARGAQEQARSVTAASALTAQLSESIRTLAGSVQESAEGGVQAAQAADQGAHVVGQALGAMHTIRDKVGVSAERVKEMGQHSEQIGMIVETIDDIAGQTNLLALNAAIEAARAGEHGKGFAVVADEVRKLAERSSAATKEIAQLVRSIQKSVDAAMKAMDEGVREVETGSQRAELSGEALQSIRKTVTVVSEKAEAGMQVAQQAATASNELVEAMDSVSAVVEENTAATEQMASQANQVSQSIENIASVSEENSAAVEEVSASTEEMTAQVEDVTNSAQALAEMAQQLQELVSRFQLEGAGLQEQEEDLADWEDSGSISDDETPNPNAERAKQVTKTVLRGAWKGVRWTAVGLFKLGKAGAQKTAQRVAEAQAAKKASQAAGAKAQTKANEAEEEVVVVEPVVVEAGAQAPAADVNVPADEATAKPARKRSPRKKTPPAEPAHEEQVGEPETK
ncbi:MAG TPA: methyl-accepting chemotaxis protein [Anaerolineaceae bacterium]|nr:methyl-accepting chemotaxis protein [Anaerolineaceae bacterium]